MALDSPALLKCLSRDAGQGLRLLQMGRGLHDAMPVSIVTTATYDALDATHGTTIDRRRFRTNIVIESDEPETAWSGARLAIGGEAVLLANQPIPRCALITIDPVTAVRDPSIMRAVAQSFDNKIGVYCAPAATGRISVDDEVSLLD